MAIPSNVQGGPSGRRLHFVDFGSAAVYLILLEQLQIWQNRHGMYATWCNSQIIVYKMYSHRPEGSPCNVIAANYVALLLGVLQNPHSGIVIVIILASLVSVVGGIFLFTLFSNELVLIWWMSKSEAVLHD